MLVAAVTVASLMFSLASSPRAEAAYFTWGTQLLVGPFDRTVGPYRIDLNAVVFVTNNGSGVDHCAVGKNQFDGGGPNTISPACGTGQVQQTACVGPLASYPVGTSRSPSPHRFSGYFFASGCNF